MSMKMGLLGRKIGMTQVFHDDGTALGVTAVTVGPCVVVGKRTPEIHGYTAIQLGFEETPVRLVNRPEAGYVKKAGIEKTPRVLREVRLDSPKDLEQFEIGKILRASDIFKIGDVIDVVGTTKGKGYQGVMKKHKMKGDSATHGTHEFFRHGGSIGCRLTPGRVHKGKRMTGRMGGVKCTSSDLVVVKVLDDRDMVLIKGAVPGGPNGLVLVKGSTKNVRKYIVPQLVKEAESKNPMKASKKGAPSSGKK
ncbi:MAG: 50S ribosomal protein L3 [Deltaproteobacteria bacterium]|nr:50S ribosomal protein L3 [Deltaproteobacteria bacterium]